MNKNQKTPNPDVLAADPIVIFESLVPVYAMPEQSQSLHAETNYVVRYSTSWATLVGAGLRPETKPFA